MIIFFLFFFLVELYSWGFFMTWLVGWLVDR